MPRQIQGSQNDFSYGEVDIDFKRHDKHPARQGGLRQMSNARIHNSGTIQNRPGRRMLFVVPASRIEEVTMTPGNLFKLVFGSGYLNIFDSTGMLVASFLNQGGGGVMPWSPATVNQIIYAQSGLSIYLTFPGMVPQVVTWDGVATWTIAAFTELVFGGQKRTWFYRISPQGIAILPSARTGAITVTATSPVWTPAHVGTRIRFVNRQILITGYVSPTIVNGTVQEALPGSQIITFATDPRSIYSVGDVVIGATSGSKGIVTAISFAGPGGNIAVQLITTNTSISQFTPFSPGSIVSFLAEVVSGPGGSITAGSAGAIVDPNVAVTFWDDEVMNPMRGYPASCFVDQFRVGFCNFPQLPNGVGWSAINSATDLYVGGPTVPNGAIFEVVPDKAQVLYVVPGPESSEFVLCDHKIFYIKIDQQNPLRPGSVSFQTLSNDGAARVQPRVSQDFIFYVNAGGNSVMAITAPGAYYRPFNTKNMCDYHSHLFSNIVALAAPNADGTFNERYIYALNANNTMACGKYNAKDGQLGEDIGWGPWSGGGRVDWIAATNADVLFTTNYFNAETSCEVLDDTVYMDASIFVNAVPPALAAPPSKGPLWMWANQSAFLMDQGTRPMGIYQIDGNGFIIPQNQGGENLASLSLVAGQIWSGTAEPFSPDAPSGADQHQRMELRQYSYFGVYVIHSTGFMFASIFSGKQTRLGPVAGAITNTRRVPSYNMDDDTSLPPIQRETAEKWTPQGSSYDPRVAVVWDTPGPIQILEFAMEITP